MLKKYIGVMLIGISATSAQCMKITHKVTEDGESYTKEKPKYILIAQFDKRKSTYSAVKYWDADCITHKENPQEAFLKLKSAYLAQLQNHK